MRDVVSIGSTPDGQRVNYLCPGCGDVHSIDLKTWTWNGDKVKPTFSPSVLVTCGHYASQHKPGDDCWCSYNLENPDSPSPFSCYRCHSFVRDGVVELFGDCTHANAGKTLPLQPFA